MPLSPQEASIRADCYIDSALRLIKCFPDIMDRYSKEAAKSALNMQLKPILGAELTKLLWRAGEPVKHFRYEGPDVDTTTDDHVIPLGVIIDRLLVDERACESLLSLRKFMVDHIVMARIPKVMDAELTSKGFRAAMPNTQWHFPYGQEDAKADVVWARYTEIRVARPGSPGSLFTEFNP